MSIEPVMRSNRVSLDHLLLLLPSLFPTIKVISNELALLRWSKYWSFSFSIGPSNEYSELISLRIDWFDLLVIRGMFKSLLQHHSSKASILQALSFLYGPTLTSVHDYWKNHCCCCPVAQSCLTLSDSVDCSIPGFPVLHHRPEFAQTQVQ